MFSLAQSYHEGFWTVTVLWTITKSGLLDWSCKKTDVE